ncbi:YlmC/YmxH family sporulation protein [Bacillus sp. M6-12]|uniref:YlmC/YmxH family sporulation protein n=1 Tax=Bacillus sp. M6-12 TaxID=2054166 RepID=UPI000C78129E|nr:YlmC/YmxH family sporulation protein [Bacillus sp. M6-12]PLS16604.1 YlmC/YmxH family sporulation protein [Bacillus sp. M6-12]
MVKISEFQIKEVVSISDGKILGSISDLVINVANGTIEAIVVSNGGKVLGFFGKEEDVIIPWRKIRKIGADVILVDQSAGLLTTIENKQ